MSQKGQYNNIIDNNINNKIDRLFNYIIDKENEIPSIRASIKNIEKKEIPGIKKSIKNIASSVYNIENNELPAIRQQRLIDSNNIAKILNNQTNLIQTLKKRNFKYISNL